MTAPKNYDGPEIWGAEKSGGRIVLRERIFKGSPLFLDLRLWINDGQTASKGATFPPVLAQSLGKALIAYAKAEKDDVA